MAIPQEQIEHLARLARLDITADEKKKYATQISSILDYFKKLNKINTDGVEPLSSVLDLRNASREDKAKKIFSPDKALAEAPELEKRQIKVKKVF